MVIMHVMINTKGAPHNENIVLSASAATVAMIAPESIAIGLRTGAHALLSAKF